MDLGHGADHRGRDLRKSWGATLVLEHADFLLHTGEKVALVGPNGSGKSTCSGSSRAETAPTGGTSCSSRLRYATSTGPNVPPETVVRDVLPPRARRRSGSRRSSPASRRGCPPGRLDAADASARMGPYESLHVARALPTSSVIVNDRSSMTWA